MNKWKKILKHVLAISFATPVIGFGASSIISNTYINNYQNHKTNENNDENNKSAGEKLSSLIKETEFNNEQIKISDTFGPNNLLNALKWKYLFNKPNSSTNLNGDILYNIDFDSLLFNVSTEEHNDKLYFFNNNGLNLKKININYNVENEEYNYDLTSEFTSKFIKYDDTTTSIKNQTKYSFFDIETLGNPGVVFNSDHPDKYEFTAFKEIKDLIGWLTQYKYTLVAGSQITQKDIVKNISQNINLIDNVDLSSLIQMQFNSELNKFSDNNQPWKKAPIVNFGLNEELFNKIASNEFELTVLKWLMKNSTISISYKTNENSESQEHVLWNGSEFVNFNVSGGIGSNNWVEFGDIKVKSGTQFEQIIKPSSYFNIDKEIDNIEKTDSTIKYSYLFSKTDAIYNNQFMQNESSKNIWAIQLPVDLYIPEIINQHLNEFYDRDLINSILNEQIKTDLTENKIFLSTVNANKINMTNEWKEKASKEFGVDFNSFIPNMHDGIFYGITKIKNWFYKGENSDTKNFQGEYSVEFKNSIESNKDFLFLDVVNSNTDPNSQDALFLVRFKTNKTIDTGIVSSSTPEIIYPNNGKNLNEEQKNEFSKITSSINDPFKTFVIGNGGKKDFYKTIDSTIKNEQNWIKKETDKIEYEIDKNKPIEIKLDSYQFNDAITYSDIDWSENETKNEEYSLPSHEKQVQALRKKMWERPINNSNTNTGIGLIVNRITIQELDGSKSYKYELNEKYDDSWVISNDKIQDDMGKKQFIVGEYKINNKNTTKEFTYNTTIGHVLSMYSSFGDKEGVYENGLQKFYKNDFVNKSNEIKKLLEEKSLSDSIASDKEQSSSTLNKSKLIKILIISIPIIVVLILLITIMSVVIVKKNKKNINN